MLFPPRKSAESSSKEWRTYIAIKFRFRVLSFWYTELIIINRKCLARVSFQIQRDDVCISARHCSRCLALRVEISFGDWSAPFGYCRWCEPSLREFFGSSKFETFTIRYFVVVVVGWENWLSKVEVSLELQYLQELWVMFESLK